jgi:hypothetical protein
MTIIEIALFVAAGLLFLTVIGLAVAVGLAALVRKFHDIDGDWEGPLPR